MGNSFKNSAKKSAAAEKILDMVAGKLCGRGSGSNGMIQEITLGSNLSLSGTTLNASGGGGGSFSLETVEKDLGSKASLSGTFDITGLSGLTPGRPVLISQAVGPYTNKGTLEDEAEMDQILCTGYVLDTSTIRAYWFSPNWVLGNFKFNYAVG